MADVTPQTRTYFAISIFSSRTFWVNAAALVVGILSATDVVAIIPPRNLPMATAIVAALNIFLRTITVRPAALIAPGDTKAVAVPMLSPPAPKAVTD
jgi:hypothetical protein